MPLLTLRRICLAFGAAPLLDGVDLVIEAGERLCLLGRNGTGKSSLLKVIAGTISADSGEIARQQNLRCAELPQDVPPDLQGTVFAVIAGGLGDAGHLLAEEHTLQLRLADAATPSLQHRYGEVHHELDTLNAWQWVPSITRLIDRLGLAPERDFLSLSGGYQRRVLLARALAAQPDLLLLDEPTNHLDIDSITWLEESLLAFTGSVLFISHDRQLVQRLATRIIELDRGRLTSFPGDYATYLRRKQEMLDAEATGNALFDKKLAQEEAWIRQGIKARRTRNEGRVRALLALREADRARRDRIGKVKLVAQDAEPSGRLVLEAEDVNYRLDDRPLVKDFSTVILRGDKIGIIGPNGCGKTTLLRLLLGELKPDSGRVRHGTQLQIAYFDQFRAQLDAEKSVQDNVAGGRTQLSVNGVDRHVISYLQDFLFSPARAHSPVKALSGGERNRLLLARLFLQPANLLVLDEPTNDLDVETLELLEERLMDYTGTLLLVSHDRAFLNNVVTRSLVFEGDGIVNAYVGGYDDWLRQRAPQPVATPPPSPVMPVPAVPATASPRARARKLSYKEQRELAELPAQIEDMEKEQARLHGELASPDFYRQGGDAITGTQQRLAELEQTLVTAYARWEALEELAGSVAP